MTPGCDEHPCRSISGLALLALLLAPACTPGTVTEGAAPRVATSSGAVQGTTDPRTGTHAFRGIPYAEPPVGDLRFKAPVPVTPGKGVLDATRFGSACAQVYYEEIATPEEFGPTDDEDCLTLNVWTPGLDDRRRPVMVWIHGGANWTESSRIAYYDGQKLSERGDVVVASLNYRLGIFGFVDVGVLGGDAYDGSENNGIRDQILALRWIRQNAGRFGGDPRNVTVFGESAGSADISAILATEGPDRLFDRAILQSGTAATRPSDRAAEIARKMLHGGGVESIDALLEMSGAEVLEAMQQGIAAIGLDGPSVRQAEAQLGVSDDVWMYRFDWEVPAASAVQDALGAKLGAAHGVEIAFLFSSFDDTFFRAFLGGWPKDATEAHRWEALVAAVQDSWTAFARSGDPAAQHNPALPHWPRYDRETRATMAFDYENRVLRDPRKDERLLWARISQQGE